MLDFDPLTCGFAKVFEVFSKSLWHMDVLKLELQIIGIDGAQAHMIMVWLVFDDVKTTHWNALCIEFQYDMPPAAK